MTLEKYYRVNIGASLSFPAYFVNAQDLNRLKQAGEILLADHSIPVCAGALNLYDKRSIRLPSMAIFPARLLQLLKHPVQLHSFWSQNDIVLNVCLQSCTKRKGN